jgi:hypothetical protein
VDLRVAVAAERAQLEQLQLAALEALEELDCSLQLLEHLYITLVAEEDL